jgi:hypothetical protein
MLDFVTGLAMFCFEHLPELLTMTIVFVVLFHDKDEYLKHKK